MTLELIKSKLPNAYEIVVDPIVKTYRKWVYANDAICNFNMDVEVVVKSTDLASKFVQQIQPMPFDKETVIETLNDIGYTARNLKRFAEMISNNGQFPKVYFLDTAEKKLYIFYDACAQLEQYQTLLQSITTTQMTALLCELSDICADYNKANWDGWNYDYALDLYREYGRSFIGTCGMALQWAVEDYDSIRQLFSAADVLNFSVYFIDSPRESISNVARLIDKRSIYQISTKEVIAKHYNSEHPITWAKIRAFENSEPITHYMLLIDNGLQYRSVKRLLKSLIDFGRFNDNPFMSSIETMMTTFKVEMRINDVIPYEDFKHPLDDYWRANKPTDK